MPKNDRPVKAKTRAPAQSTSNSDLDHPLKLLAARTLANAGYYTRVNVAVSATGDNGLSDITDIDTLALRHDLTFKTHTVGVSCKGGANVKIAHEIFYIRGVLDYVAGDEGMLLSRVKAIPVQLRNQAAGLNIATFCDREIDHWAASVEKDSPTTNYFDSVLYDNYQRELASVMPGNLLVPYLRSDFWFFRDFRNIQNLLTHFRKLPHRLDGRSIGHSVLFLETAAHLCLSLFDVCRYLQANGATRIVDALPPYLFGGFATYKSRKDLLARVGELMSRTGTLDPNGPGLPALDPHYINKLSELCLRYLERPQAAILVPLIIQDMLWRALGAQGSPSLQQNSIALVAHKLTSDLFDFMKYAADHPWKPS